jgi:ribosomal protein L16/L10AE
VDDAARTAILAGRGVSRVIDSSDKGLPVLLEKMNVYVPTAAEMKQFRDLAIPAARAFLERTYKSQGKYWVDRFLSAVEEAEAKLGY